MNQRASEATAAVSLTCEEIPTEENGFSEPNLVTVRDQAPLYARASVPEFGKAGWKSLTRFIQRGPNDVVANVE